VDGQPVKLADYKGKVVLVDFWASWAPVCVAELPHYAALARQYKDKGFEVVGINLDTSRADLKGDTAKVVPALRRYLVSMKVPFPVIVNGRGAEDFARAYGVTDIPANFLIDRDGKIVRIEMNGPELDKAVAEVVAPSKEERKS